MQLLSTIVLAVPLFMSVAMANPNVYDSYKGNSNGYAPSNSYNTYDNKAYDNNGYDSYNAKDTPTKYGAKDTGNNYYSSTDTKGYEADTRQHCIQEWFGTAPLCRGECPKGWRTIRTAKLADKCEQSTDKKIVESCEMISKNICVSGIKTLCEKCY
ncbi:uncharacterized protein DFL_006380 [Arthrobotrys flagrans]|uniref:Virulence factor cyrA n=1 Tax=Arthrobotrys flagrans TaxID=97331 RepID=CYRA_ARTFL|nr:hypothetical protein DFL_006380 [Arthrobotrys flagrans]